MERSAWRGGGSYKWPAIATHDKSGILGKKETNNWVAQKKWPTSTGYTRGNDQCGIVQEEQRSCWKCGQKGVRPGKIIRVVECWRDGQRGRQMKAIYSELEYSLERHRPASVVAMLSKEEVVCSPVQSIKSGYWVIYWIFVKKKKIRRLFQQVEMRITHTLGLAICSPAKKHYSFFQIKSIRRHF